MGADIHIVLGRIKPRPLAITDQSENKPTAADQELSVIIGQEIRKGDIELMACPRDVRPGRNYQLFSWLACLRGNLKPLHPNIEDRHDHALRFAELLDFDSDGTLNDDKYGGPGYMDIGDHSYNIMAVQELVDFNYDQRPVYVGDDGNDFIDLSDPTTYRECFSMPGSKRGTQKGNLTTLIDYCTANGWQFILFGFDN